MGEFVRQYHNVDVNVAVASPAGLMVPFVRDADRKGLMAISEEVKGLAAKVRPRADNPKYLAGTAWELRRLPGNCAASVGTAQPLWELPRLPGNCPA